MTDTKKCRIDDDNCDMWHSLHEQEKKIIILNAQIEVLKGTSEDFKEAMTTVTEAVVSIDKQFGVYVAEAKAKSYAHSVDVKYIFAAVTILMPTISYLVIYYLQHQ